MEASPLRRTIAAFAAPIMAFFCTAPAGAVMEIDITQGNLRAMPIAISPVLPTDPGTSGVAESITQIITGNLERSGLFQPIDRAAFLEQITNVDVPPRFRDWSAIKAEALVVAQISGEGGRIKAQYRLWDVFTGRELRGEAFYAPADSWRRIGHIIADAVYERLTGEKGYFDSRVAFIEESGPKKDRIKRLAIMDQDGHNLRYLTEGRAMALTPRFSPNNREITYTSYDGGQPAVLRLDLITGRQQVVANMPGMSFAPRFSPRGYRIVMSLQREGASNVHEMDLRNGQLRPLTHGPHIDTGPCYSPDGRQIVFESDRTGHQQLFVMSADGGAPRQITNGDGRYSTPVWSPRGDLIAFTKQIGGNFLIGVIQPDGRGERILTEGYHNEGPSWSPNGRVILFFRESAGEGGGPRLFTIDLTGYNERSLPTPSFASDPAWSLLMN
jgi:TolB protein